MKPRPTRSKATKEDAARDENQVVGRPVGEIEERDEDSDDTPAEPRRRDDRARVRRREPDA